MDCVFCKIVAGKENAEKVRETENLLIIKDINPQASLHYLIIPKKHVPDVTQLADELWKEIKDVAVYMARERSVSGFRLLINAGDTAAIPHMQVHFLADVPSVRQM